MDKKEILYNTVRNSQYIIKGRLRLFLKDNDLLISDNLDPYEIIDEQIDKNLNLISKKLSDYEFDKPYKYFTLYNINNNEDYNDNLLLLDRYIECEEKYIEFDEELSYEQLIPTIKKYDTLNEIDIKFSLIKQDRLSGEYIKYPIIATIFKDIKLISIKFCGVSEKYIEDGLYVDINNLIVSWIKETLDLKVTEFKSIRVFKILDEEINTDEKKHPNISIYRVSRQDENDGRSSFCSTKNDKIPIIDDIRAIVQTFENENDKNKILSFINRYEEESIIRNIALKWRHKFRNSNGKVGNIAVGINMINSTSNFSYDVIIHHIYQQFGINRERINHVIRFISDYSK